MDAISRKLHRRHGRAVPGQSLVRGHRRFKICVQLDGHETERIGFVESGGRRRPLGFD